MSAHFAEALPDGDPTTGAWLTAGAGKRVAGNSSRASCVPPTPSKSSSEPARVAAAGELSLPPKLKHVRWKSEATVGRNRRVSVDRADTESSTFKTLNFFHSLTNEYHKLDKWRKKQASKNALARMERKEAELAHLKSLQGVLKAQPSSAAPSHAFGLFCMPGGSSSAGDLDVDDDHQDFLPAPRSFNKLPLDFVPLDSAPASASVPSSAPATAPAATPAAAPASAATRTSQQEWEWQARACQVGVESTEVAVERKRAQAHGVRLTADYNIDRLTPEDRWFTPEAGWPQDFKPVGRHAWAPTALMETASSAPTLYEGLADEAIGVLRLEVLCAEGLQNTDLVGVSDPYAIVLFESNVARTQTIWNDIDPRWDYLRHARAFRFPVRRAYSRLFVALKDDDAGELAGVAIGNLGCNAQPTEDDDLGRVCLQLSDLIAGVCYDAWFPLQHEVLRHHSTAYGRVRLRYSVTFHSERLRLLSYSLPTTIFTVPLVHGRHATAIKYAHQGQAPSNTFSSADSRSYLRELRAVLQPGSPLCDALGAAADVLFWRRGWAVLSCIVCLGWQWLVDHPSYAPPVAPLVAAYFLLRSLLARQAQAKIHTLPVLSMTRDLMMPVLRLLTPFRWSALYAGNLPTFEPHDDAGPPGGFAVRPTLPAAPSGHSLPPVARGIPGVPTGRIASLANDCHGREERHDGYDSDDDVVKPGVEDFKLILNALKSIGRVTSVGDLVGFVRFYIFDETSRWRHKTAAIDAECAERWRRHAYEEWSVQKQDAAVQACQKKDGSVNSLAMLTVVLSPCQQLLARAVKLVRIGSRVLAWDEPIITGATLGALLFLSVLLALVPWSFVMPVVLRGLGLLVFGPHMHVLGAWLDKTRQAQMALEARFDQADETGRAHLLAAYRTKLEDLYAERLWDRPWAVPPLTGSMAADRKSAASPVERQARHPNSRVARTRRRDAALAARPADYNLHLELPRMNGNEKFHDRPDEKTSWAYRRPEAWARADGDDDLARMARVGEVRAIGHVSTMVLGAPSTLIEELRWYHKKWSISIEVDAGSSWTSPSAKSSM